MTSIVFEFLRLIDEISLILLIVSLLFYIILSLSLYNIYKKNNMNATKALIPIYNIIPLLELVDLPKFLIVVIFVPYINILGIIITNLMLGWRVSKAFNCNLILTFCLIAFPFIGYPILAIKDLEYHELKPSPKLFVKKVVEEKKEETIDIPRYDIDMSNIENVSAVGINDFFDKNSINKPITSNYSTNTNEVEDLTFDYNQIYTNDVINEEEKTKMNYDLQDVPVSPVEPVIPEPIQDVPIAPVEPVIPEPVQDIPVVPVEPVIPDTVQDIPVSPVEPVIPEPLAASYDTNIIESVIPEEKEEIPQFNNNKPKPYSKDGYTFDYNSLYNISPSDNKTSVDNEEIKKEENDKKEEKVDPLNSLQMAAPPSFDTPIKVEKKEEEQTTPIVPEINKSDLVSIDIKEPDVLPVGTLGRKKNNKRTNLAPKNGVVFAHPPTNNNANINNLLRNDNRGNYPPNVRNNVMQTPNNNGNMNNNINSRNNANGRGTNQNNNVHGNPNNNRYRNNVPNNNVRDNRNIPFNNSSYNGGGMVSNPNMNYNSSNNQNRNSGTNTFNNSNFGNNAVYRPEHNINNMNMNSVPQSSLLRPNEDSRAYMNSNQSRGKSKFISNDDNKYTLPKSEPLPVQMPTDPNLIANPMAIFGSNSSVLRPTSGEAMYQNYNSQPMQQQNIPNQNGVRQGGQRPMNNTCPNCGFVIKPGQPSCVVCGYRLM